MGSGILPPESACQKTFVTAELFESILLQLPLKSVLLLQRVSKSWKAAITKSSKVQKSLFLDPIRGRICDATQVNTLSFAGGGDDLKDVKISYHTSRSEILENIKTIAPSTSHTIDYSASDLYFDFETGTEETCMLNPFLNDTFRMNRGFLFHRRQCAHPPLNGLSFEHPTAARFQRDKDNTESWRTMYITQPPLAQMTLQSTKYHGHVAWMSMTRTCEEIGISGYCTIASKSGTGLKIADLLEGVEFIRKTQRETREQKQSEFDRRVKQGFERPWYIKVPKELPKQYDEDGNEYETDYDEEGDDLPVYDEDMVSFRILVPNTLKELIRVFRAISEADLSEY